MSSATATERVRLGDIGRVITGRTPPTVETRFFGDDYPFVTPSDMTAARGQRRLRTTERGISQAGASALRSSLIPVGAVFVSCIGWQLGKVMLSTRPCFTNQQINTLIPDGRIALAEYLYYALSMLRDHLLILGSVGTRTPIVNKGVFASIAIDLPPLPVQRRIAGILGAYDDLIENNLRRIAILEEMARNLYREWFVEFRYPGHERDRLVDSPIGPVPEGWEVKRLGEIVAEKREPVDPTAIEPDTPYIGLEHMPRRSIALGEWGRAADVQSAKLQFRRGDILFGKIRPYFHKVGVALTDGVCSTDIIVLQACSPEYHTLALMIVSSDEFIAHAVAGSQGTKMPRANWSVLQDRQIPVPPLPVQALIAEGLDPIAALLGRLAAGNRHLNSAGQLAAIRLVGNRQEADR